MGMKRTTERLIKLCNEEGGISKLGPIDLSIVRPCLVTNVDDCENTIPYTILVAHIGNSLSTAFPSSTSIMLHSLVLSVEPGGETKALFRNLENYVTHERIY